MTATETEWSGSFMKVNLFKWCVCNIILYKIICKIMHAGLGVRGIKWESVQKHSNGEKDLCYKVDSHLQLQEDALWSHVLFFDS